MSPDLSGNDKFCQTEFYEQMSGRLVRLLVGSPIEPRGERGPRSHFGLERLAAQNGIALNQLNYIHHSLTNK